MIKSQYEQETNNVFNVQLSGSTFTGAFFSGNQLFTANAGDSRTILISIDESQKVKVKQLTTDHKPDNPKEKVRV